MRKIDLSAALLVSDFYNGRIQFFAKRVHQLLVSRLFHAFIGRAYIRADSAKLAFSKGHYDGERVFLCALVLRRPCGDVTAFGYYGHI